MPNCDFYSLGSDSIEVLRFVFSQPGWQLYENYSEPDSELRWFEDLDSVRSAYDLEAASGHFQLYSPTMGPPVRVRRIDLKPGAVRNASIRYSSEGWGLIQLYFEAPRKGVLRASHTNHNSRKRALAWQPTCTNDNHPRDWNWDEVERMSKRLNRHIRGMGVAKLGSRAVLPCAHEAASREGVRLWMAG